MNSLFKRQSKILMVALTLILCINLNAQVANPTLNPDTVKSSFTDMGKMWTFENPPLDYWKSAYNFQPTQQWLDDVRLSALKFANWCSASFVSEDGLILTNHHCAREVAVSVQKKGEDILNNGFIAKSNAEERKIPDLFVDQLIAFKDVTKDMLGVLNSNMSADEKWESRNKLVIEMKKNYRKETGADRVELVKYFNGNKFAIYAYKTYKDIRLVFIPEVQIGYNGGDYDNFTYPRYAGDFSFFRAYDNGKPIKVKNFFKFSLKGPKEGEDLYTIGNPARSSRLRTVAELDYSCNYSFPAKMEVVNAKVKGYQMYMNKYPDFPKEVLEEYFGLTNTQKVNDNSLKYLYDPYIIARKKDFEKQFIKDFNAKPELVAKYGNIWEKIAKIKEQEKKLYKEYYALGLACDLKRSICDYSQTAFKLDMKFSKNDTTKAHKRQKGQTPDSIAKDIFRGKRGEERYNKLQACVLQSALEVLDKYLKDYPEYQEFTGGKKGAEAVEYILSKTKLTNEKDLAELLAKGKAEVYNDHFMKFFATFNAKFANIDKQFEDFTKEEENLLKQLGSALYEVYGNKIAPDATFTLRISDGVVGGYEYNGTLAPAKTTFYGLFDKYYSHSGKADWKLPESWIKNQKDLNMSTNLNFVFTADVTGGSSGSPIINHNKELVGVAFDGNIESTSGDYILTPQNRCVGVDSEGMLEALAKIYKAQKLVNELKKGKM